MKKGFIKDGKYYFSPLPPNLNCCDIREREDRPCGHEPSDYNEDCLDCKHFVWVKVIFSR